MMKFIWINIFLLFSHFLCAQSKIKKIYYNQDWRVVQDKTQANYYAEFEYLFGETGTIRTFRSNGSLYSEGEYLSIPKRIRSGKLFYWYPNGQLKSRSFYQTGKLHGELVTYYNSGEIKRLEIYEEGKFKFGKCFTTEGLDTTWHPYSEPPIFPQGRENYFEQNLKYPETAYQEGVLGTVLVSCVIDSSGKVTQARVVEPIDSRLDTEALRLVNQMPTWIAGKKDGIKEPFLVLLPIHFSIMNPSGIEYDDSLNSTEETLGKTDKEVK